MCHPAWFLCGRNLDRARRERLGSASWLRSQPGDPEAGVGHLKGHGLMLAVGCGLAGAAEGTPACGLPTWLGLLTTWWPDSTGSIQREGETKRREGAREGDACLTTLGSHEHHSRCVLLVQEVTKVRQCSRCQHGPHLSLCGGTSMSRPKKGCEMGYILLQLF